jgi:hypothetical protein
MTNPTWLWAAIKVCAEGTDWAWADTAATLKDKLKASPARAREGEVKTASVFINNKKIAMSSIKESA